ncbi:MAG: hypothetical protein HZA93_00280 [Verrucomicrobia bacterium]|nr:hypothetical protein [Verrucomicrobiota bacterium]
MIIVAVSAVLLGSQSYAQTPRERNDPVSPSATAQKAGARPPARGSLPDPALLDGAAQPVEKRPEYGMLGEFEIPGDPNATNDRVGGQPQQGGGRGGQQLPNMPQGGGGSSGISGMPPMGMPQGGGSGGQPMPPGAQGGAGGAPGAQGAQPGQQGGAGLAGGQPVDPSQANGQAGGIQVAELKTDEANAGGVGGEPAAPKPGQVAIGDSRMQIKGAQNAPGVIGGAVSSGSTQQMEKAVGGGKGGGGAGDNSNKGVEKGRVVPSGL